ncbi:MAG TPA: hypothetical protein VGP79_02620 [Bryobacteraceae bacterium]|jgi:hypothetical protein|nr:hypothetical protein [Bryobacteraceae bacterium]
MKHFAARLLFGGVGTAALLTGQAKPVESQTPATVKITERDSQQVVEITNVAYETTSTGVPGRPQNERLLLRKITKRKQVVDEIGEEASTTIDAWPLGTDLSQPPIYSVTLPGIDCESIDGNVLVTLLGLEDTQWWSVNKLGTGEHLFDTYVPLLRFSISREVGEVRYVGLDVPPDNTKDSRLKDPHVVAVLTYASRDKVLREVLITADDPKKAQILRSYSDATRTVTKVERETGVAVAGKRAPEPARSLRITFSENYPSPPNATAIVIPIVKDDLDVAHATVPLKMHVAAWKR